jgi:hypothetical protein
VTGNEGGAQIAALEEAFAGVDEKIAFDLFGLGAVAGVAAVDQDRADALLEELEAFRVGGGILRAGLEGQKQEQGESGCRMGSPHVLEYLPDSPSDDVNETPTDIQLKFQLYFI